MGQVIDFHEGMRALYERQAPRLLPQGRGTRSLILLPTGETTEEMDGVEAVASIRRFKLSFLAGVQNGPCLLGNLSLEARRVLTWRTMLGALATAATMCTDRPNEIQVEVYRCPLFSACGWAARGIRGSHAAIGRAAMFLARELRDEHSGGAVYLDPAVAVFRDALEALGLPHRETDALDYRLAPDSP